MRIPDDTIDRIKQAADIVEVVGDFVSLKKRGSNYIACCPFHNEKSPSFNVNPARQIYKCFGCGKAGDSVRFVMDVENIGYVEALRFLAKKYGIEIEEQAPTPEDLLKQNERESLFIVLNFAKTYFHDLLTQHEEGQSIGLSYFRERGFTTPTIDAFELGYSLNVWDGLLQEAEKRGYNRDILEKAGLILNKESDRRTDDAGARRKVFDRFRGRVMFPIHNVSGRVIAFGARILVADKNQPGGAAPKYLNSPETDAYHKSQVLYGIYQAKQTIRQEDVCYLTEGYTDVISLHQAGIKNVVASSGTSLTLEQIRLIARFTPNVTILYDGDAAGIKAALRGLDMVLEEGLNVSIVTFPDGEDPDSYVRRVGAEAFKTYIKTKASDFIRFKTETLLRDAGDNPFKRAEVIGEVVSSIVRIPDALQRQVFFRTTAQQLRVDEQTLISEGNRLIRKQQEQQSRDSQRQRDRANNNQAGTSTGSLADINALLAEAGISSPGNLDGPPDDFFADEPGSASQATTSTARTRRAERTALSYQEEECIRLLVNYGARELEPGITLCQYVLSELDDINFQTTPYDLMLRLYREAFLHGDILTADDFLNKADQPEAQQEAITLTTPRHEISDGWLKHEIIVPSEEDLNILADAAFGNVLRIKKMLAEEKMLEIRRGIVETTDPEESDRLMADYMHFKRIDVEIAKLLGTVISG